MQANVNILERAGDLTSQRDTLESHINSLFSGSHISSSIYDTAWLLRIPDPSDAGTPMFPQFIEQLQGQQAEDGSWGSEIPLSYTCDSLVCTMSAVVALATWRERFPVQQNIDSGLRYIAANLPHMTRDAYSSVGYELVLPALIEKLSAMGLMEPPAHLDELIKRKNQKLTAMLTPAFYKRPSTILHSLEALTVPVNWHELVAVQDRNGGFLSSPSAAARFYMETGSETALAYLRHYMTADGIPVNTPIDIFEMNWCLEVLLHLGLKDDFEDYYARGLDRLRAHWTDQGISWGTSFDLPDLDNTSVTYYLLREAGDDPSVEVFQRFVEDDQLKCFPHELDSSPTHLLHFLQSAHSQNALTSLSELAYARLKVLLEKRGLSDKWHLSPFYTLAIAIRPLGVLNPGYTLHQVADVLSKQRDDGGWGVGSVATTEETAWTCYALFMALDGALDVAPGSRTHHRIQAALREGVTYLLDHQDDPLPNLWIDKCLYTPFTIVNTVISAVIYRYLHDFHNVK